MTKVHRRIILVLAIVAASVPAAWLGVQYTDAYLVAESFVQQSSDVRDHVGEVRDIDLSIFGYKVAVSGARGDASFTLNIKGSRSDATGYVELAKLGIWRPTAGRLVLEDGNSVELRP